MNVNRPSESFIVLPGSRPRARTGDTTQSAKGRRTAFSFLPKQVRHHVVAFLGEFVGTFLFLFFAFAGTQVANSWAATQTVQSNPAVLLYIALSFGFSLAVNAWVFFRISGGLFNPAVTLGMCLIGAVSWFRGLVVFIAQIVGGIAAAGIVSALFPGPMLVRTTLANGTSVARGIFIEMFLTAQLIFTIFMLAAEKHKGTFLAPVGIGLSLFIAELGGVAFTGGSLNPARSFGPEVIAHTFAHTHYIYWLGPALGALLAVIFYRLVKALEYETANPGQDFNDKEAKAYRVTQASSVDGAADPDLASAAAAAADLAIMNVAATGDPAHLEELRKSGSGVSGVSEKRIDPYPTSPASGLSGRNGVGGSGVAVAVPVTPVSAPRTVNGSERVQGQQMTHADLVQGGKRNSASLDARRDRSRQQQQAQQVPQPQQVPQQQQGLGPTAQFYHAGEVEEGLA